MKYPFLLLISLLYSTLLFAQTDYKPGYAVTLNGDTLKGFIDYKGWDRNPTDILFKADRNATIKKYTIADISAFGVTGLEYYERRTVPVSKDDIDVNKLSVGQKASPDISTVFLRILTEGKLITLYSYIDDLKKRYYVADNSSNETQELEYHLYFNTDEYAIQTSYRFRTQLENMAQKFGKNNPELDNIILKAKYNDDDLLSIAIAINGSVNKQFISKSLFGMRLFSGISVVDNAVAFNGSLTFSTSNSIFPKLTGGVDFIPNKIKQQLFFRLEVAFTGEKHNLYSTVNNGEYNGTSISNALNYSQFTIIVTPQIIYNFYNAYSLKTFIGAGFSLNNASYNNYKTVTNFSNISTLVRNKYPNMLNSFVSFPVKAGVLLNKKLELYAAYTFPVQITQYTDFSTGSKSYQVGFNYLFGKK